MMEHGLLAMSEILLTVAITTIWWLTVSTPFDPEACLKKPEMMPDLCIHPQILMVHRLEILLFLILLSFTISLWTKVRNMWKIFFLIPSEKPVTRENWDELIIYFLKFIVTPKKDIYHLAIWQNWCFGQFHHSKIEK